MPTVHVVSAAESAARDRAAIAGGIPSRALMRAAGMAAASEITRRYAARFQYGVAVYAGPGNNGGNAWVVAGALAAAGVAVRVHAVGDAGTPNAIAERVAARDFVEATPPLGTELLVVDGLLGTGARGAPHGAIRNAIGGSPPPATEEPRSSPSTCRAGWTRRRVAPKAPSGPISR